MRFLHVFVFVLFLTLSYDCYISVPSFSPLSFPVDIPISDKRNYSVCRNNIEIGLKDIPKFLILFFGLIFLLCIIYLQLCTQVRYATFNTDLTMCSKRKTVYPSPQYITMLFLFVGLGLILTESSENYQYLWISCPYGNYYSGVSLFLKFHKKLSHIMFYMSSICIFYLATTPAAFTLSLLILQNLCHSCIKKVPNWLPFLLIILSNDIHLNPGPGFHNNFFNFLCWNLNSLVKEHFERVHLIEAHNSIYNYDLMTVCETSLNDSVELPETLINDYTFVSANNPLNTRQDMAVWVFSIKILFLLQLEEIYLLMNP